MRQALIAQPAETLPRACDFCARARYLARREVNMRLRAYTALIGCGLFAVVAAVATPEHSNDDDDGLRSGRHLFERETFGGNGRTCRTCHGAESGTVSPADAVRRFEKDPSDPLFLSDGSDDGLGSGVTRMLRDATILMKVPLAPNVSLVQDPGARFVTLRRGIPTTLNTPALDPVLMYDGRQPNLSLQARGAIIDHAQATRLPSALELFRIAEFQHTRPFFSSNATWQLALHGRDPGLPEGRTASERRGRIFFEDAPFAPGAGKAGICAICHSGPMLDETNEFIPVPPLSRGGRFQTIFVSELNQAGHPVIDFQFRSPDGSVRLVQSADPGRALITGDPADFVSLNAFKIPTLRGVERTAPYFHDNSAKTLEDVARHYRTFFEIATDPSFDGDPPKILTEQDQADIVAFLKLLR
jgi:cytochrome c peroxidase